MDVAIAHDYCTQRGGAERVALGLAQMFNASLWTALYEPSNTYPEFDSVPMHLSHLQRLQALRADPRKALPLLPMAWARMEPVDASVVVASSSGFAHSVPTTAQCRKIVYCHTPARWLYAGQDYTLDLSASRRALLSALTPALRRWDQRHARRADLYVANSTIVARRIEKAYGVTPQVVHPPSWLDRTSPLTAVAKVREPYFLMVGRGRGYKHGDLVEAVFSSGQHGHLVVVGDDRTEGLSPHVTRLPRVSDSELRWLYANARAVVSLSREDFGLTPVEGFSFGTPAVLLRAGGFLDSMVEGVSGVFVEERSEQGLRDALRRFEESSFSPDSILEHAERFSVSTFERRLRALISTVID